MDAVTPGLDFAAGRDSTRALLARLWREHVSHHRPRLLLVLVLTCLMAGTTALYPVVIDHAFQMFTDRDRRILYQIPALVVAITSIKAAAQVLPERAGAADRAAGDPRAARPHVLASQRADLARLEREAPAQLAARFTTDAAIIRDALTRTVNGVADAVTVVGTGRVMLYFDWLLSLIAAALYPLAAVPIQNIGRTSGAPRRHAGADGRGGGNAERELRAGPDRAGLRLEDAETERRESAFAQLYRALMRMAKGRARSIRSWRCWAARRWPR